MWEWNVKKVHKLEKALRDFVNSVVHPISTKGDRLCPPNYYWHTRIFRPSDGPELNATS